MIFTDYTYGKLTNVDIVKMNVTQTGIELISQSSTSFCLGYGDKVFVWRDIVDMKLLCEAYLVD